MNSISPPVRGTLLVAAALGVPLQLVPIDLMKGEHLQPEYVEVFKFIMLNSKILLKYLKKKKHLSGCLG